MIDHTFYRKIGEDGIQAMFDGSKKPEEVFQMVQESRSSYFSIDQLETTNACNMQCMMCPRGKPNHMSRPVREMDMGLFRSLIDQIAQNEGQKNTHGEGRGEYLHKPPPSLIWPGSEYDVTALRLHHFGSPTLDRQLLERVQYVKEYSSFPIQFSDTIVNMRLETARELFRLKLDRLIVCLDGITGEDFERVRGVHVPSFEKMIRRMQDIVDAKTKAGGATQLDVQLIKLRDAPQEPFLREWGSIPGVNVHIKPFFPYPDVPHDLVTEGDTVFQRDCRIPFTSLTVLSDGQLVPCNSDYNGEQILGDSRKQSLKDIWESAQVTEYCRRFIFGLFDGKDLCNRCGFYPFTSDGKN